MKKRLIYFLIVSIVIGIILCPFDFYPVLAEEKVDFLVGEGTKYNPYLVSSYEDIAKLRDAVDGGDTLSGKYFRQTDDIIFPDGVNWNPIGDLLSEYAFGGFYDGNGYTLSNIYSEDPYAGVFSFLAGEVRNLGVESGSFHGSYAGSITSHGTGTAKIINCYNKADVYTDARAGGITDNYSGMIMFCWNFGSVIGLNEEVVTAGITSYGAAKIEYCYAVGGNQLTSDEEFIGDITKSHLISHDEVGDYMQQFYQNLFIVYTTSEKEQLITRGNTIFMIYENDGMHFSKEYEPEIFLAEKEEKKEYFLHLVENKYNFEGNGTEKEPFLITSYDDLVHFRDCVNVGINYDGCHFEQTTDIYFPADVNWDPIGDVEASIAFSGIYDGKGHCLHNIYCEDEYAGVFALLDGEVRNLGIESGRFCGNFIGSIANHGIGECKIFNCYNKADIVGMYRAGGLVDDYAGEVLFSWNFGTVSGETGCILASICSYGSADIRFCYSTEMVDAVSLDTFSGKFYESGKIMRVDVGKKLEKNKTEYENYMKEMDLKDGVFLKFLEPGEVFFDKNTVSEMTFGRMRIDYAVEVFLLLMVVILGVGVMITNYKFRRNCNPGKVIQEELVDSKYLGIAKEKNSRKQFGTRILSVTFTLVIFYICFSYITEILNSKSVAGILNLRYWKKEENKNTDILFLGGSSMSVNIEIGELWKKYGIACYCVGAGGATIDDSYYRLIEAEKRHQSDMVVVEVRGASSAVKNRVKVDYNINASGLDISLNKLNYVNATIKPEQRLNHLLNFPLYHDRYNDVTKWDFLHTSSLGEDDKGTWTVFYDNLYMPELICADDIIEYRALGTREEYYLEKIIEYCDVNGKELLLLKTPDGDRRNNQPIYNTVNIIAEAHGVPFLDLNQYDKEIGLTDVDFYYDNQHLNIDGARKCTNFFGNYLKENYNLVDHRGDEDYMSWDRFAANREDLYLRAITDNGDYIDEIGRDHKKIIAIFSGLTQEKSEQYLKFKEELNRCDYELYDAEDMLYGENNKNTLALGFNTITIQKDYSACFISINEKTEISVGSPGVILIVYDEVTDKIADISAFTRVNGFSLQHFYEGSDN